MVGADLVVEVEADLATDLSRRHLQGQLLLQTQGQLLLIKTLRPPSDLRKRKEEKRRKLRKELKEEGYGRGEIKDVMLYEKKKDQIRKNFEDFSGFAASSLKMARAM